MTPDTITLPLRAAAHALLRPRFDASSAVGAVGLAALPARSSTPRARTSTRGGAA